MLFLYYPKCSTCQKAKKWLDANHISYEERHIVEENPTYEELKQWYEKHIAKQIGAKFCPLLHGIVDPKQYSNGQFFNLSEQFYLSRDRKEHCPSGSCGYAACA